MSAMIFIVSLQMWLSNLFGQQSQVAPYSRSCAAEEMKDVSYADTDSEANLFDDDRIEVQFDCFAQNGLIHYSCLPIVEWHQCNKKLIY
jgi:hypothetical protein